MKTLIEHTADAIGGLDAEAMAAAQRRLDSLTKPPGSLGRLEELAKLVAGIRGRPCAPLGRKVMFVLAADHGVAAEGVSPYPAEVTAQMVSNFLAGGAGINVLARHAEARVVVADVGVVSDLKPHPDLRVRKFARGTGNIARGPAMTRAQAREAIENGIALFEDEYRAGVDIIGLGEMGIGNTTAASAITAVFTGRPAQDVTGRGAGLDDNGLKKKIAVVRQALEVNRPDGTDAIDVAAKVGGFEIAGLAGIILAAAARRVPVVLDGFISGAAALIAHGIQPKSAAFMIAAHRSVELGHAAILDRLGLAPLVDLKLRLGEGTGAALAMTIIDASLKVYSDMATFESAGVSREKHA